MPPEPVPKIFISYAWKNQPIAKRLQSNLQRDGVEVFVDYEKIAGGDSLPERISAALEWCNTLILLWSAEAAESYYVKQEWSSAFHLQKKIIACVLDGTKLPAVLVSRLYLNFAPYETGYAQLCRSLGVKPKPPVEKPAPSEAPKSKLPPQHAQMPVPQPPEEKRETPPPVAPKRKSIVETFRRKPKPPDPPPVLKPPEIFNDTKYGDANATEEPAPSRWPRRKIISVMIVVIAISVLIGKMVCKEPAQPVSILEETERINQSQTAPRFRNKPATLSVEEVKRMLTTHGFFDSDWHKDGKGIKHQYKDTTSFGKKFVIDRASNLMWQQSGSEEALTYEAANVYVVKLRREKYGGYSDWRLPTLEEAMSLMEQTEPDGDLYIDLRFDRKQRWIWTADQRSAGVAWVADFDYGGCGRFRVTSVDFVRVVR